MNEIAYPLLMYFHISKYIIGRVMMFALILKRQFQGGDIDIQLELLLIIHLLLMHVIEVDISRPLIFE